MNLAAEARAKAQAIWPGATVFERGRGHITHQHPTEPLRRMFDSQVGGKWHYGDGTQEIDTAWVASGGAWDYEVTANDFYCYVRDSVPVAYRYYDVATGHYVELTFAAVQWVNDEGQSEAAASFSQVTPTIDDDKITWTGIATGWDVSVEAQTARLAKLIDIDTLAHLGAPSIGGTNQRLRISLQFQKSSGLEIWSDGVQWGEVNATWQETNGSLEFRDETTQDSVFWFKKPWAEDSNADQPEITQRVRRLGVDYYAEIDVPWTWLQSATYPITIDPTVDDQIDASADDASENEPGAVVTNGTELQLREFSDRFTGARFTNVAVTNSATIDVAYIQIRPLYTTQTINASVKIENTNAPAAYSTSTNDITGRSYVGTSVTWNESGLTHNVFHSSPSLTTIVDDVVALGGWASGDDMAFMLSYIDNTCDIKMASYDNNSAYGFKFHLEYTTGGGTDLNVRIAPWVEIV